jgi:hypothetical protein
VFFIQEHADHCKILRQKCFYLDDTMISAISLGGGGGLAEISKAARIRTRADFACDGSAA